MFNKILIANRGEIACRVIQTAHKMGIRCVAVYSDADQHARHVAMADEAYYLGPSPSAESYLRADKILAIAKQSGAEAVHPGYGFLSENSEFAQACSDAGVVFIGPPIPAIEAMGSKSAAKKIMEGAGVPLVPGYHGEQQDPEFLLAQAQSIGFPVLLKAAFGGGGKGMRVVWNAGEFNAALASAKREAQASFGNDQMLLEKYLTKPRHVEIQVFCDNHGNAVYLAERDCSVQRRHQKVVEEAPAPNFAQETRAAMGDAAVKAALAIGYQGAGTVEFLYDEDGSFYFMEMNTRLQVEHPVTEMITGQDLVKWQLLVANNQLLPLAQQDIVLSGHAIEVRIYAEDPDNEFLPASGKLTYLREPAQNRYVRVDTGVREGDEVTAFYDPMIAKLIVWDENRDLAIKRALRALNDYRIAGIKNNIAFLSHILGHSKFQQADLTTGFIAQYYDDLFQVTDDHQTQSQVLATLYLQLKREKAAKKANSSAIASPWFQGNGLRLNETPTKQQKLQRGDNEAVVDYQIIAPGQLRFNLAGHTVLASGKLTDDYLHASLNGHQLKVAIADNGQSLTLFNAPYRDEFRYQFAADYNHEHDDGHGLVAPMNGTVVAVLVAAGDEVKAGQALLIMEAMKMEYTISAKADGTVAEVFYAAGDLVSDGAELIAMAESV